MGLKANGGFLPAADDVLSVLKWQMQQSKSRRGGGHGKEPPGLGQGVCLCQQRFNTLQLPFLTCRLPL